MPRVAENSDPPAIQAQELETESLDDLVDDANRICLDWNLRMEFALKRIGDGDNDSNDVENDDNAQAKVVVKKHLDGQRYSLVEWGRPMLEAKVVFLRQFAASLEDSGSIVVVQDNEASIIRSEASVASESERQSTKFAVHREPDAVSEDVNHELNGGFPSPEPQSLSVSSSSLEVSPLPVAGSHQLNPSGLVPPPSNCIRLIGQGRIFMPPLKSYSNGPTVAAVLDAAGLSIGRLFVHLQYTTIEKRDERRPSLLAMARSASFRTLSPTSSSASSTVKAKAAQSTTMRIHLDKLVFDESQPMACDGVSLTLKKWSNLSSSDKTKNRNNGGGGGSNGSVDLGLATNFSTPKAPPLFNEKATTTYAPLKIFQVNKVFETRLCFTDLTTSTEKKNGASSGDASDGSAQDDFVAFEVWGYGKASLSPQMSTSSLTQEMLSLQESPQPISTLSATRKVDFYVSVDIDEREQDGIFRPVAVKADGALRIHANQPRRLNVRVTQADQQQFALSVIAAVLISPPFCTNCETASLSTTSGDTNKSTQWLLSPSSTRSKTTESRRPDDGAEVKTLSSIDPWRALDFRTKSEQDVASRSLSASLKWDRDPQHKNREGVDGEGSRSVFRVVVALTTPWSCLPIMVSKSVVTKISSAAVTTKLKLTRELETSRTAWWARESFSREYRLGTWYTADVTTPTKVSSTLGEAAQEVLLEHGTIADQDETTDETSNETVVLQAVVNNYVKGLLRLEMVLELEHLRQQVLKMIPFSTTETISRTSSRDSLLDEHHHQLTFDKVTEALSTLFESSDDQEQRFELVQLANNARQLFLRKKTNRELLVGVKYGNVVDLSPADSAMKNSSCTWGGELHAAHFVTEPSHLASGSGGEMSGFLMLSTAFQLDETAIAPLAAGAASTPTSSNAGRAEKPVRQVKANWERRWFVLKRPFLYAYKTFALKEEVGVLDISKCQLLTTASSGSSSNGWSHPSALSISHASSSSSSNSKAPGPRGNNSQPSSNSSHHVLASTPFSFQLVCLMGAKCVVWTLQASTSLEMRAWLVAIDPLKIEAREAVVNSQSSSLETPVITA